jgi:hypothetical protein
MAKVVSKSSPSYARGGNGSMAGKTGASPQKPGTTSGAGHGSMSGGFAKGGSGHMVGKQTSKPVKGC